MVEKILSSPITVLGAGSWGTALAVLLARNGQECRLWGNDPKAMAALAATRCNEHYLPGVLLPDNLLIYSHLDEALHQVDDVLLAVPSHAFRSVVLAIKPYLSHKNRLVWATKGLDPSSGALLHTVIEEELGKITMAVLSGPNFAKEVAAGLPAATAIAANSDAFARDLAVRLRNPTFRVYVSQDMIGVEVGGVVKNVLAIATGISDGLGYGANARSALITRGLAEMTRLGLALGGHLETFMGLAGLGDLVLTCTDNLSRNRRFGLALGEGATIAAAEIAVGKVVEGRANAAQVHQLAQRFQVEMPIVEQVFQILNHSITPKDAVTALLSRESKKE